MAGDLACFLVMEEGLGSFAGEEGYAGIVAGGSWWEEGTGFEGGIGPEEVVGSLDIDPVAVDSCFEEGGSSLEGVDFAVGWMKTRMEVGCCVVLQALQLWLLPCQTWIGSLAFCC